MMLPMTSITELSEFDRALQIEQVADDCFTAELTSDWAIGNAINGGILMALSATAAARLVPEQPHPLTWSGVFVSPGEPGPITLRPTVLRKGRGISSVEVVARQAGAERFRALLSMADLANSAEPVRKTLLAPPIAPFEECTRGRVSLNNTGLLNRMDTRIDPATAGWAAGNPSGEGEIRAWMRLADGREPDPVSLLLFLDAMPPVAFDLGSHGWVPTVEFTGHVRAVPAPGALQSRIHTTLATGGLLNEDCEIWDSTGRLVAQSRQLCSARYRD
jgi:acyl-CoA thioesterase